MSKETWNKTAAIGGQAGAPPRLDGNGKYSRRNFGKFALWTAGAMALCGGGAAIVKNQFRSDIEALPSYRIHTGDPAPTHFAKQYTVVCDTNHTDLGIIREFHQIIRNFVGCGGTDVVLELPAEFQEVIDTIRNKRSDYEAFTVMPSHLRSAEFPEAIAIFRDILKLTVDSNVGLHVYSEDPPIAKANPDLVSFFETLGDIDPTMIGEAVHLKERQQPGFANRFRNFLKQIPEQRILQAAAIGTKIKKLAKKPTDKVLVVYGAGDVPSIIAQIGPKKSQTIFITSQGSEADIKYAGLPLLGKKNVRPESSIKHTFPAPER